MDKGTILKSFIENGILISPNFLNGLDENFNYDGFFEFAKDRLKSKPMVFNNEFENIIKDFKDKQVENKNTIQIQKNEISSEANVIILKSYNEEIQKKEVKSFVNYFKNRYNSLRDILSVRQELQESVSISRLTRKKEKEVVSVIGMVLEKIETKNGNIKITLEDTSGIFDILIMKNKKEVYDIARDLVLDEVVGVAGVMGEKIIFCNSIILPEIPINNELKKSPDEVYAVFISDIHFGIKNFLDEDFMKFISWLKGEFGNDNQRDIANKVKYLFVTGDVVEGIGIYPGQEEDLEIKDIYGQYEKATKYFKMIPRHIKIIICGGNHDAIRMSEPQPLFDRNITPGFYEIPNMVIVSNPAMVNIHSSEEFPGFNVLMYHGFSFPFYADAVPSIRSKGGLARCDLIMRFLLQRRHLAPSHSSTQYVPDENFDPLVIDKVPDIFVSGHIHQITTSNYRNVSLINSSCWVIQSEDNAKRGIIPNPAKIPIMNLKTREVRIMNFLSDDIKVLVNERLGLKG